MSKRNYKGTENMEDTAVQPKDGEIQGQRPSTEAEKSQAAPQEQIGGTDRQECSQQASYKITCRNKVSKRIGGVDFINGVGHTGDSFKASWFANKDGYEVGQDT